MPHDALCDIRPSSHVTLVVTRSVATSGSPDLQFQTSPLARSAQPAPAPTE